MIRILKFFGVSFLFLLLLYILLLTLPYVAHKKVPQEILDADGPVSEPCARAMAEGARRITGADLAVSVTGVAGPEPDERGVPVGIVYIGLATPDGVFCRCVDTGKRQRSLLQGLAANHAFDVVRRYLTGLPIKL